MPVIKEMKIDFIFSGKKNFIYPTLIKYKNELILVDAGYQNIAVQIEIFTKLTILAIGMPVLLALLELIGDFLI